MSDGASPSRPGAAQGAAHEAEHDAEQTLAHLREENARLEQALRAATDELQRLRFSVGHDLRTPLRHVGAFAQVIEEDFGPQLDAQVLAHLATIRAAAVEMGQLLNGILEPPGKR